ncbi:MAG TPA: HlyD family type I secretion periplasmic adaptor subunit [Burkholderiales bacterium]|nr:HlyD family type I secretion periplasmic adaptor subunit [Burkholderiales bacterium]
MGPREVSKQAKRRAALMFAPDMVRLQLEQPSPMPRAVLYAVITLLLLMLAWAIFGKLDIVAVTHGKLIPQSFLKIVQPAEAGVVRDILVAEGQCVREGEVLVRMDSRLADADLRTLQAELARKRLQLRRIEAELTDASLQRAPDDPAEMARQVEAQLIARRQAYLDALGAEEALRARAEHDLGSAAEIEGKLSQTAPIYREQEKAWDQLAREGYAGRLLALDRQRVRIEVEQELKAQTRNVESLRATITQAEKRIAQIHSNYRQQLHNERSEAEAAYHKLQQEWDKQRHRHALLELKAPQSGIVKDLATHTPGTVLAPGTIVLTLVPQGESLIAEVWVGNADAGFVQPGQKARVKLATYPFQKFGMLDGTIHQVSADAQDKSANTDGSTRQLPELAYRALVKLASDALEADGQRLKLVPGMIVTAEVHLGRRTVLEYLLSPLQKIGAESARER